MTSVLTRRLAALLLPAACVACAHAAPVNYKIDPDHTYPSFEADHMGGLSVWRGKFSRTRGAVVLDKAAGTGTVDITVDPDSVDFGQRQLNNWAKGKEFFDTENFASATYRGTLQEFKDGAPSRVAGQLTLHGVTRPLNLEIRTFKCVPHPIFKRDLCGADAYGTFNREQFGLSAFKDWGFDMDVALRIQVEALAER